MKICAISDIHGDLIKIPKCDVLCICGDIVSLSIQRDIEASSRWWAMDFTNWVNDLPCKKVIITPGNHDFYIEHLYDTNWEESKDFLNYITDSKVEILIDESYTYNGVTFYGTPWIAPIMGQTGKWAFEHLYMEDGDDSLFYRIPKCDILLTHDNPNNNEFLGSYCFGKFKHHFFGHWHDGISYGHLNQHNCSILDDWYNTKKNLQIVTIDLMSENEIVDATLLKIVAIAKLTLSKEDSDKIESFILNNKYILNEVQQTEDEIPWQTEALTIEELAILNEDE